MSWREIPILRLLFPLGLGMALASLWYFPDRIMLVSGLLLFLFLGLIWMGRGRMVFEQRTRFGVGVTLFFLLAGTLLTDLNKDINRPDHYATLGQEEAWFTGVVYQVQQGAQRLRLMVAVDSMSTNQVQWKAVEGNLQVILPIDGNTTLIGYGQAIQFKGSIEEIPPALNPKVFDYRNYLHQHNIYYRIFAGETDWRITNFEAGNPLLMLANSCRKQSVEVLREHLSTSQELAVGMALILGNKSEIDESVRAAYANTGAMHVLAVSGLHIGMVYLGISFLLGLIPWHHRSWKLVKVGLTLVGVWSFALITGASPSVLRAATMFSFLIIGLAFSRYTNIYNTLAASAFVLLCFDPLLWRQVGFQLSYLAVLGIIYFQPLIYRKWYIKNPFGNYLWKLVSVSLAAQITTFPLSLFYFHQFPLYFWLSGLVVVPAAVLILTGGLLLLFLNKVPVLGWLLGKALYLVIWLTNALIFMIEKLPAGLVKGIWISSLSLILLYGSILFLTAFLKKRQARWALASLLCMCCLGTIYNLSSWQQLNQRELTIYQLSRHTLIDIIEGRKLHSLSDAALKPDDQVYSAGNYRLYKGVQEQFTYPMTEKPVKGKSWLLQDNFLQFGTFSLALVDGEMRLPEIPFKVDYVLLRDNPELSIEDLMQAFQFSTLIIDGSNYRDKASQWTTECKMLGLPYYNLPETGALTIDLNHPPTIE